MDFISRLQRNINNFVAETLEDSKKISEELEKLKSENARLLSVIQILCEEKECLLRKLRSTSCTNCDSFKQKAIDMQDKLNLVYKALYPILGASGTEQLMTQQRLLPDMNTAIHSIKAIPNPAKCAGPTTRTDDAKSSGTARVKADDYKTVEATNGKPLTQDVPRNGGVVVSNSLRLVSQGSQAGVEAKAGRSEEDSFLCIADGTDEMLKEVAELSSVEMDSQFVSDMETPGIINDTPVKRDFLSRSMIAERVLREILGPSQPAKDVLVPETPPHELYQLQLCEGNGNIVPESEPQFYCEKTPKKMSLSQPEKAISFPNNLRSQASHHSQEGGKSLRELVSCPAERTHFENVVKPAVASPPRHLTSPTRNGRASFLGLSPRTPKRKRTPPRKTLSPRRTPWNKLTALKKSGRIEADITCSGVNKLMQTKLNVMFYKKPEPKTILETPPRMKMEDDDVILESPNTARSKIPRRSPPLTNIANLDETLLSMSAIRKVASDVVRQVLHKRDVNQPNCSYDNLPVREEEEECLKRNERLRKITGQECPDCEKFYELMGHGDIERRQELLNQCSKHRTNKPAPSFTPPGFWKPMLSQTLTPLNDETL